MDEWIIQTVEKLGLFGIALLSFLENVFPPIPSELIMPLAGFSAARGELTVGGVIIAGTIGSLLGAILWYFLARWVGEPILIYSIEHFGCWFGISMSDYHKAQAWFVRHGTSAIFFGRLVPAVRTLISIPAGLAHMNFATFLLYSLLGTLLWTSLLVGIGMWLGEHYDVVNRYIGPVSYIIFGLIVGAFLWWIITKRRSRS